MHFQSEWHHALAPKYEGCTSSLLPHSPLSKRPPFASSKHWHVSGRHSGSTNSATQLHVAATEGFQQWKARVQER